MSGPEADERERRRVLNTGSGPPGDTRLHPAFVQEQWDCIRFDIDPRVAPDVLGTVTDMSMIAEASFDAIWCSHNLEHLHGHEVVPALKEFYRVLKSDGFALITCPDLDAVASLLLSRGLDDPVYMSAAGPIAVADMLFGHRAAVAAGFGHMAHNTGFTSRSLGRVVTAAGFREAYVGRGEGFDLWAVACMPDTKVDEIAALLSITKQAFLLPR